MKKFLFLLILCSIFANLLFADVPTNNIAQNVMSVFKTASSSWITKIVPAAMFVFWALVTIDWVISFGYMAIKGTDFAELFYEIIRKVIIIGFFLMLFAMTTWLQTIPKSFSSLANNITSVNIQPDTILEQGIKIVSAVWDGTSIWSPGDSLGLFLAGIIILIAFALMAAELFITLVKLYLLIAGTYLIFSLGGLTYTRSYAINPIIAVIKAGMELFFIKVLMGFSINTITVMSSKVGTDNNSIMAMIITSVLIVSLVKMTPGLVESLVTGQLAGNSNAGLGMAKNVAAAGAGAAVGAVAGGIAANSAINAAKELKDSGQGSTLGNLAKAAGSDAISTITGANKYTAGNMGVRMAETMKGQAQSNNTQNELNSNDTSSNSGTGSNDLKGAIKEAKNQSDDNKNTSGNSSSSSDSNLDSNYISGVNNDVLDNKD